MENAERLICNVIRGDITVWPEKADRADVSRFIELLRFHGVTTLVARGLSNDAGRASWPAAILDYCREQTLVQAVSEMTGRAEIARVLQGLASAGIKALLLKGGSLAYSLYENPVLRPRGDTDLLVPPHARRPAEDVLRRLAYAPSMQMAGEFISYQENWAFTDRVGVVHDLDLHWRVNNSQLLANLLDYDELAARATGVAALGANASALAPVHALLFACMHLAGHRHAPIYLDGIAHPAGERLIWLYDIHLLVSAMPQTELDEFTTLAARKQMTTICRDALRVSAQRFLTQIPEQAMQRLSPVRGIEPSARYCSAGPVRQMVDDFLALDGAGARARLLRELLFPAEAYMRDKYRGAAVSWLPFLYARRAMQAFWRLAARRFVSARGSGAAKANPSQAGA